MSSICIIPARGGSKRILKKNLKFFMGKPIIEYSLKNAINSKLFDEVFVSTDDFEIANFSSKFKVKYRPLRSKINSNDYATTADVLREVLSYEKISSKKYKYVCCLYPTAPLVNLDILKKGFEELTKNKNVDCVYPVVKYSYPIQRSLKINSEGYIEMINEKNLNKRSQDFEDRFHDTGQFYFFKTDIINSYNNLFESKCKAIIVDNVNVQDIDNEEDWKLAELKYKRKFNLDT